MALHTTRYIVVVPADQKGNANDLTNKLRRGNPHTVSVPLLPENADMLEENISAYWFNWNMYENPTVEDLRELKDAQGNKLINKLQNQYNARIYPAKDWTPQQVLENEGLKKYQEEIL